MVKSIASAMHSGAKLGESMSDVFLFLQIVVIDGFLPFNELRRKRVCLRVARSNPSSGAPPTPAGMMRSAPFDGHFLDALFPRFVRPKARPRNRRTKTSYSVAAILHTKRRRLLPPRVECRSTQTSARRALSGTYLVNRAWDVDVEWAFDVLVSAGGHVEKPRRLSTVRTCMRSWHRLFR